VIAFAGSFEIGAPPRTGPKPGFHELSIVRGEQRIAACRLCGAVCAGAHNPATSCQGELLGAGPDPRHVREHPHYCDEHRQHGADDDAAQIPRPD
jgi:hypothetical protein